MKTKEKKGKVLLLKFLLSEQFFILFLMQFLYSVIHYSISFNVSNE